jgi:hypothetical protein
MPHTEWTNSQYASIRTNNNMPHREWINKQYASLRMNTLAICHVERKQINNMQR